MFESTEVPQRIAESENYANRSTNIKLRMTNSLSTPIDGKNITSGSAFTKKDFLGLKISSNKTKNNEQDDNTWLSLPCNRQIAQKKQNITVGSCPKMIQKNVFKFDLPTTTIIEESPDRLPNLPDQYPTKKVSLHHYITPSTPSTPLSPTNHAHRPPHTPSHLPMVSPSLLPQYNSLCVNYSSSKMYDTLTTIHRLLTYLVLNNMIIHPFGC